MPHGPGVVNQAVWPGWTALFVSPASQQSVLLVTQPAPAAPPQICFALPFATVALRSPNESPSASG